MTETTCKMPDPRVQRTRKLLQSALGKLLKEKGLEDISVQDIADAATLNRATFYDHYNDKFALLECMVGSRFNELLAERGVCFDRACAGGLGAMVLGICDFLKESLGTECEHKGQLEPHLESAVVAVVRKLILEGLKRHPSERNISPEMVASTVSWAIFGAAKEWIRTPNRCSPDEIVETVTKLVAPILG